MKIKTTPVLKDLDDADIPDGNGGSLTLGKAIQTAMLTTLRGDEELTGERKAALWQIAVDAREEECDWTPEVVTLIRERIGRGYPPAVVGPAYALLNP